MTRSLRWMFVALALVLVVGVPVALRRIPAQAPDLSAATVLSRIRAAAGHPYSGTVELSGDVALPVTSHFTDVGALLGGRTTLRVWWRGPTEWRVAKLLVTGETDLFHDGATTTEWRYDTAKANQSIDPEVRLPRTADLLPPAFAARAVEGTSARDVRRLPARRIAGIGAVGLRIHESAPQASIDHVDLWADPRTGIVLRMEIYARHASTPSFSTAFTSYSPKRPSPAVIRFAAPQSVPVRFEQVLDIADAANQYAPVVPPQVVDGLKRSRSSTGAVGIYGTGLTRILAIPLRRRDAATLLDQVSSSSQMVGTDMGPSLMAGPLGVLVTDGDRSGWLLVGAVTRATLVAAAHDLVAGSRYR
ncbi:MAG: hypothetical protein JWP74_2112 [Marmoricola sp.]|nr:hypothetical protein [Marmoricola sp.]